MNTVICGWRWHIICLIDYRLVVFIVIGLDLNNFEANAEHLEASEF